MYHAEATLQDDEHHGSTRLHLDLTDAVNIELWAANFLDGTPGYAIWHIFAADALPVLHLFFIEEGIFKGFGDSVHSQVICMTPSMLECLLDKHRIRPYTIRQYAGQAVYIPVGCAHQV